MTYGSRPFSRDPRARLESSLLDRGSLLQSAHFRRLVGGRARRRLTLECSASNRSQPAPFKNGVTRMMLGGGGGGVMVNGHQRGKQNQGGCTR